jgi:hypothetical protein
MDDIYSAYLTLVSPWTGGHSSSGITTERELRYHDDDDDVPSSPDLGPDDGTLASQTFM